MPALAVAVLASGCFSGRLPARELYRLSVPPAPDTPEARGSLEGGIAVARYQTPGLYSDGNIVFRTGDSEYGLYPSREWGIPLGEMLGLMAENALQRRPLTIGVAVFSPPAGNDLDYVWRGMVREFEEVNRGREVFAAVRLDAQLVRVRDGAIIWRGSSRLERPVPEPTMHAIVATLSALAVQATETLIEEARMAISAAPAVPAASTSRAPR